MEQVLLLVDDEPNILNALTRLFRRDGYVIHTASGGAQALEILKREPVGVVMTDQRMPGMTGAELLVEVRKIRPQAIRIILSGYTELETVVRAINTGAAYKFLTKPWEEDLLKEQIREAFTQYNLLTENIRLTEELLASNEQLNRINLDLEYLVDEKAQELVSNLATLRVAQEILDQLPIGVIGVADDGLIACCNQAACQLISAQEVVGMFSKDALPQELQFQSQQQVACHDICVNGQVIHVRHCRLGLQSAGRGSVILLIQKLQGSTAAS